MTPKRIAELQDYVRNEPRAMQPAADDLLTIERAELADLLNAADAAMEAETALELVIASAPEIHGDGRKPERTWGMSLSLEPIRKALARLRKARGGE